MSLQTIEEKQRHIAELKAALADLEAQLDKDIEASQHEVIDHVDQYFNAVETKFSSLKTFWQSIKSDWRNKNNNSEAHS